MVKAKGVPPFDLDVFLAGQNGGGGNRKYKKGEIIFTQGDACDGVFYVQEGRCKITVVSERGKEAVVALHEKGDFFGEGCLTGQTRRLATAIAMTDCELLRLDSATIERVIHEETEFSEFFIARLLARNARVEADLVDQLFNSSERRLARQLLLLANFGSEGKSERIIPDAFYYTPCPHCGFEHLWWSDEAWLTDDASPGASGKRTLAA
jgi:CRP/FNR family cyclic AMP-dependent transcriptional regulator